MKNPLGVSPRKGYQGNHMGERKNSYDLVGERTHNFWIRSAVAKSTSYEVGQRKSGTILKT